MRFCSLGSGSRGNATLVDTGGYRILVDNGFSLRELLRRLERVGVAPATIDCLLLTHEHADHVKGVASFVRRHDVEVWTTPGTWRAAGAPDVPRLRLLSGPGQTLELDGVRVSSYPVPHDAREPCQFVFESGGHRLGMLTDCGRVTPHIQQFLSDCDALILEFNHDSQSLQRGPYPLSLQRRISGGFGHLSNRQAGDFLDRLSWGALQHLVVAHVSEANNHPDLVLDTIRSVSTTLAEQAVLWEQDAPSPWCAFASGTQRAHGPAALVEPSSSPG
ncbi:hypothetical protein CKO25_07430 [Thiocapsa imhoffii]|uniref:Metallo-beta-lactamase domain-containing protein n=1 Tax=Thiocapsa imhoffii TaxID=382777 RepID=A0A9X0WGY4_9GAMM|nr:hypothetical protein [Thiocapsa imhoffii]